MQLHFFAASGSQKPQKLKKSQSETYCFLFAKRYRLFYKRLNLVQGGAMFQGHQGIIGKALKVILIIPFLTLIYFDLCFAAEKKGQSIKGDGEMEKLKNTQAVIETRFGNIEVKFHPD